MREFSDEARKWLSEYHGSIDSTALLMAFDAGRLPRGHKQVLIGFAEELDQARAKLARIEALCNGAAHAVADDPQDVGAIVTDMALEAVRDILCSTDA